MFKRKTFWYKIFSSKEEAITNLPQNKICVKKIAGKIICVVMYNEKIYAMADKCPHNGASLSHGYCTTHGELVCPLHRYHFSLVNGRTTKGLALAANVYPVEVRENGVYLGIEKLVFGW